MDLPQYDDPWLKNVFELFLQWETQDNENALFSVESTFYQICNPSLLSS